MFISQTDSTNRLMRDYLSSAASQPLSLSASQPEDGFFISTDYQTAGRGQVGNHWESEDGKNILASILIRPQDLEVSKQFRLSMIASLSVLETLNAQFKIHNSKFSIKWPNDIYYEDKKLGGILIENILHGGKVSDCIFGLGLNVNQERFISDAPNPTSLIQITGRQEDRNVILTNIRLLLRELESKLDDSCCRELKEKYIHLLYHREGVHEYEDIEGRFQAVFKDIDETGRLVLTDTSGKERTYLFKQLKYIT